MDINSIIDDVNSISKGAAGNTGANILKNLNIPSLIQEYITQNGLNISQAGLKNIVNNPSVKQGVENAVKSYAMTKLTGNQNNTILSHLGPVADTILAHTTNIQTSKQNIINDLKDHILRNIKI